MKSKNIILIFAETLVIGGIIFAFVSPLFSPSEENNTQESSVERSHDKSNSKIKEFFGKQFIFVPQK